MFEIYVVKLPKNYNARILAFKSLEKATEICDALKKQYPVSGSSGFTLYVDILNVFEDNEIQSVNVKP